jgi:hypothetical protein
VTGNKIVFDASADECRKFATPISVILKTGNDIGGLKALQGGKTVFTRKLGANTFSVTADPTLGDVELDGCMANGPAVDATAQMPAKPEPAKSVCDLDYVKGRGAPGKMDDLERPTTELQLLPNPSQGDGRNGSWSWYPPNAQVKIVQDGRINNALRYSGGNLGRWSGVTLAFIGGNGAGICYDATAYKGIRFRIRGNVLTPDKTLENKAIVTLVSAPTQTRKLGGDLNGEGGHFHKVVPVSPEWETIEVRWEEFERPAWGVSTTVMQLPLDKLQAVDWGVSDRSTQFELFIDDIELF